MLQLFAAARDDGVGLSARATFATTSVSRDTAVPDRSLSQAALEVMNDWSRAHLGVAIRRLDHARPRQFEGTGAWSPFPGLTLAGDARHAEYSRGRSGNPAHLRSEEHTSELQSQSNIVCRLLLEKRRPGAVGTSCCIHIGASPFSVYSRTWRVFL